jgi:hypothetical protein
VERRLVHGCFDPHQLRSGWQLRDAARIGSDTRDLLNRPGGSLLDDRPRKSLEESSWIGKVDVAADDDGHLLRAIVLGSKGSGVLQGQLGD